MISSDERMLIAGPPFFSRFIACSTVALAQRTIMTIGCDCISDERQHHHALEVIWT